MQLQAHFASVARALRMGRVTAMFHPYSELKHTWCVEKGDINFKISDYLEAAPDDVLESLAWYLITRAAGGECPPERSERYLTFARSRELWQPLKETYLRRSQTIQLYPCEGARDLRDAFEYVNSFYFEGRYSGLQLAWARESPRRRLGYYFEPLGLLAVNKALDSAEVPRYVLEFVIFHELLHHMDSVDGRPRKRVQHTKRFREQERRFSHYEEADAWLRRIAASLRRSR